MEIEYYADARGEPGVNDYSLFAGRLRKFNLDSVQMPVTELQVWLAAKKERFGEIHPTAFEKVIRDCFKNHYGAAEVEHVGQSHDRGIDLKIVRNDVETILVQVKRRQNVNATEGVRVVRELNGVLLRENCHRGIVVTTASKFSPMAHQESQIERSVNGSSERFAVELVALDAVRELIARNVEANYRPWQRVLHEDHRSLIERVNRERIRIP